MKNIKFYYEDVEDEIGNIDILASIDPSFAPLIKFITDWRKGVQNFQMTTSGSTGSPKTILISRQQIEASVFLTKSKLNISNKQKALICLDPKYIATIMMAARCLIIGMDMVIVKPTSNPLQNISKFLPIHFASFVPIQIEELLKSPEAALLGKIENILVGGAPLSGALIEVLNVFTNNIYQTYGMTETVSHIALMPISKGLYTGDFEVLKGIEISKNINDCLKIKGRQTNELWVETTDIVSLEGSSKFKWLGRADNIINTGGIKIIPEVVESQILVILKQLNIDFTFFIHGLSDLTLGFKVVLFIERVHIEGHLMEQINGHILKILSKYHVPRSTVCLDKFVRTNSGKLNRKATLKKHGYSV